MRSTSHLILSTIVAYVVAMWLFAPIFYLPPSAMLLHGIAMVTIFIFFAAIGSIAPDIDKKNSMVRSMFFAGFYIPFLLFALVPLSFVFDFNNEKLSTRIKMSLYEPKYRGAMHSLIGVAWSAIVVYFVMRYMTSHFPAMAAAEGFLLGYLLHLIEDAIFTKTPIKPFVTDRIKIGG